MKYWDTFHFISTFHFRPIQYNWIKNDIIFVVKTLTLTNKMKVSIKSLKKTNYKLFLVSNEKIFTPDFY